jgi:NAD(P) transhydrogenase subunit alpha
LIKQGIDVHVEAGAGAAAGFPDAAYVERGATIVAPGPLFDKADIIVQVNGYGVAGQHGATHLGALRKGQAVVAFADPLTYPERVRDLAATGAIGLSMELMPRITRAQSMDALSSLATVAGYKAVILAAEVLPRMFPMFMTAAGTITPARVFVLGAGVAGLQAIATAKRLGARVYAYDVRPAVAEQVRSLGAKFVELELETKAAEDAGGYATEQSEEFLRRQREQMGKVIADSDVVITTAAIPGRKAPILVTADQVAGMAPGSVIVDLAAERGGNCELTAAGQTVVENDVTILGPTNLPATVPYHASQMFAKNLSTFLLHLVADGRINIDTEDEITAGTLVTRGGEVVNERVRELLGAVPVGAGEGSDA